MRQGPILGVVGALVFLGVAVATLPASLLVGHLPAELKVEGASGSVWNGAADSLALRGTPLGSVVWQAEPAALLSGRLSYHVEVARPDGFVHGRIAATLGGTLTAEAVELQMPITALTRGFSEHGWRGDVAGTIRSARIEAGWPVTLDASFLLSNLHPPGTDLSVGSYALEFDAGASSATQLVGRVRDHEAPLAVRAQLLVRRDRSYLLEGEVTPRSTAPPEIGNAIAFLGAPDSAGRRAFTITGTF